MCEGVRRVEGEREEEGRRVLGMEEGRGKGWVDWGKWDGLGIEGEGERLG